MTPTRRRGAELEHALHAAILAEIDESGIAGLTYEGVAERAGTSKPVLYRRWPTKPKMLLAAITAVFADRTQVLDDLPDAGSLTADLAAPLTTLRTLFTRAERRMMMVVLAELDPEAAEPLREMLFTRMGDITTPIVERARARGELSDVPLGPEVLSLPFDLARHDIFMRGVLTDDRVRMITEQITAPLWVTLSRRA